MKEKNIGLFKRVGSFAENKDLARDIRLVEINPALVAGQRVVLDFSGIESTTQSFIHALISELIRADGPEILDRVSFKNCSATVKKIISIVVEYMQEAE